ncbi:hypothetical protein V6259_12990 [Marinomonas sp. TI.3.20]|uniref:hypothetical protein n=1 Tax=Marinomonas sp. TI.3.20 TaxID=3121296 RepID=UPI0031203979
MITQAKTPKELLCIAEQLATLAPTVETKTLENNFGIKRAIIYNLIYIHGLCDEIKTLFSQGKIGLKPLVELDKKYGTASLLSACSQLLKETPDKNIKKPAIEKLLKQEPVLKEEPQPQIASSTIPQEIKSIDQHKAELTVADFVDQDSLKHAKGSINSVIAIINDAASLSQDSESLMLCALDYTHIMEKLHLHSQFLDDLDINNERQGDQTDQSIGSYVFDTMVDSPVLDEIPNYEDISQDWK